MPGTNLTPQSEGVRVPVTTGEFSSEQPSTVPERVLDSVKPPEQPSQPIQVPVAETGDAAMQTALGQIDQVASASGQEFREENMPSQPPQAGEPVTVETNSRQAVDNSLRGKNPENLEALVGGGDGSGQVEEPAATVSTPESQAPIEAAAESLEPDAVPDAVPAAPAQPETPLASAAPEPVVGVPAPSSSPEVPPDAAPVIAPRLEITKAEESVGMERALKRITELREKRDRADERVAKLTAEVKKTDKIDEQAKIEMEIITARKEAESYDLELVVLLNNLALYMDNRIGASKIENNSSSDRG